MSYLTFFSSCGHFCTAIIRSCRLVRENGHLWSEINLCEAVMEHFSIFQNFQIFYSTKIQNHLLKFLKRTMTKLRLKNEKTVNVKCTLALIFFITFAIWHSFQKWVSHSVYNTNGEHYNNIQGVLETNNNSFLQNFVFKQIKFRKNFV